MKLEGKVAFITGFGSGLGQAIAVLFAKEGAAVAGTSTTEAKGRDTVAMIENVGEKALFRPGDVCNSAQMKALIDETVKQFGGMDIVINSGGCTHQRQYYRYYRRTMGSHHRREPQGGLCGFPPGDPGDDQTRRWSNSQYSGAVGYGRSSRTRGLLRFEGRDGHFD